MKIHNNTFVANIKYCVCVFPAIFMMKYETWYIESFCNVRFLFLGLAVKQMLRPIHVLHYLHFSLRVYFFSFRKWDILSTLQFNDAISKYTKTSLSLFLFLSLKDILLQKCVPCFLNILTTNAWSFTFSLLCALLQSSFAQSTREAGRGW